VPGVTRHPPEQAGAEGSALMRLCILAGSAALLFATGPPPARGADEAVQVRCAGGQGERSSTVAQPGSCGWLWGLVRDRLTIPLGQAEWMDWPSGGA
jgi:hypothetical protein